MFGSHRGKDECLFINERGNKSLFEIKSSNGTFTGLNHSLKDHRITASLSLVEESEGRLFFLLTASLSY